MEENKPSEEQIQETLETVDIQESAEDTKLKETLQKIKETAREEDPRPSQQLNLRTILGGDLLTTSVVRSQIWLFVLIVVFSLVYVAFRYQCHKTC
jgi:preprotein translocase subunit SecF